MLRAARRAQTASSSLTTEDADLATASLALSSDEHESFETIIKRADKSFTPLPNINSRAIPSRFGSASGFLVDLLTPQLRRSDSNPMPLKHLAAGAIPLQHLGWLIQDPLPAIALHGPGVPITVPQPARYAAHKLIVAQKRRIDPLKREKDLVQAEALIAALRETDPYALSDSIAEARSKGEAGWAGPIARSLKELDITLEE